MTVWELRLYTIKHEYETTLISDHIRPQYDISPGYCLCYMRLWDNKVETGKNYIVDGRTNQSIQPIIYNKSPFMTALLF